MDTASLDTVAASSPEAIIARMQRQVVAGQAWFEALMEGVARWTLAEETVGERHYRYLVGGEAFDWLLLAERLCQALDGYMPPREREELLFFGRPPVEFNEEDLRRAIGYHKYRAHLNYLYGVLVEEALQLAVEEDLHKEQQSRLWANGPDKSGEDGVYLRIYGRSRDALLAAFRADRSGPTGRPSYGPDLRPQERPDLSGPGDSISCAELKEFTYWLFKCRLRHCEPARVASDTRRGLAMLERLRARGRLSSPRPDAPTLDGRQPFR